MNERIRELARRVVGRHRSDLGSISLVGEQIEEFGRLLAQECANIDFRHKVGMTTDQEFDTSRVILEHFGVEE